MSRTIIIESFQEFAERHGNSGLACGKTGLLVWPDGASALQDDADTRSEPPDDPQELLVMQRRYFREALRRAEAEFQRAQQDFAESAALASRYSNLPGPPVDAPQILKQLAGRVRLRRAQLAVIEKELVESPSPETLRTQAYQQRLAEERTTAGKLLHEIQNVTV
jgi:hypothetical protein